MTELVITRGLPASGKTTWAHKWVRAEVNRVRVSRDDLRMTLFGLEGRLPQAMEEQVTTAQRAMVRDFLRKGISVVVDDTNLNAKFAKEWVRLAEQCGARVEVNDDFLAVPADECVLRDLERRARGGRYVGAEVIKSFHDRYLTKPLPDLSTSGYEFTPYVPDTSLPKAWICDLDGTLAIKGDRDIYDGSKAHLDTLNEPVADLLWALDMDKYTYNGAPKIIYLSGRDSVFRDVTQDWLNGHDLPAGPLFMRAEGDRRDDAIIKHEILMRDIAPKYHVLGTFDDRDRVVAAWRRVGIFCAQVNYGEF